MQRHTHLCIIVPAILTLAVTSCASQTAPDTPQPTPTEMVAPTQTSEPRYIGAGTYFESLKVGAVERAFLLHVPPSYEHGTQMPLVFSLHGAGGNAFGQENASQWFDKADEEDFIVVNPQAMEPTRVWLGVFLDSTGDPDVEFIQLLLDHLTNELSIDPARIYATGLSNGGTMTNRLGCDFSDTLAAIAPVAGAHSGFQLCEVERPVSVLALHGTDDRVIPYLGNDGDVPPVRTWVEAWAGRDRCAAGPAITQPYEAVSIEAWSDCSEQTEVALLTVHGGGHTWLGIEFAWEEGRYVAKLGATDVIWDFFESHPKQPAP